MSKVSTGARDIRIILMMMMMMTP